MWYGGTYHPRRRSGAIWTVEAAFSFSSPIPCGSLVKSLSMSLASSTIRFRNRKNSGGHRRSVCRLLPCCRCISRVLSRCGDAVAGPCMWMDRIQNTYTAEHGARAAVRSFVRPVARGLDDAGAVCRALAVYAPAVLVRSRRRASSCSVLRVTCYGTSG
ncbi:hypothetical protein BDZ97DRAFT_1878578 [Flammula alnicola]|nr:hypothetical protein BDZ97DRAFT_1878578 [Flammula alnicola]